MQRTAICRLDQHLCALETGAPREPRRDRRIDHAAAAVRRNQRAAPLGCATKECGNCVARPRLCREQRKVRIRRQMQARALSKQGIGKPLVIVRNQRGVDGMLWKIGLH